MIKGKQLGIEVPHDYDRTLGELLVQHVGHVSTQICLELLVLLITGHVGANNNKAVSVLSGRQLRGYKVA